MERCSRLRRSSTRTPDELAATLVSRTVARRVQAASEEAAELQAEILAHVRALAPKLLDEPGVGQIVAAQLDHPPGRTRDASAPRQSLRGSPA
jgi:transposase